MITLTGYHLLQELFSTERITVFRAETEKDHLPVILKVLREEYPDPKDVAHLKHEFSLLKDLKLDGIVKTYGLEKHEHRYVLVLEDVAGGVTLEQYIQKNKISIEFFLKIAVQLAKILYKLHLAHIIHKDINPSNIIIGEDESTIKLIDFSIATKLSQEVPEIRNPEVLEGTLAYMSPEQSSRMNRTIDRRTDLYSLGITFYQMLAGHLPFEANDAIEWVHCHIAKPPQSLRAYRTDVPEQIEKIIMKLLSKAAEDRYLSAFGLKADLQYCQTNWLRKHEIEEFALGQKDKATQFKIPEKLYGREAEIQLLLDAFERLNEAGRELLLVSGYAGIGKSSLVNEIHKPIVRKRGYFSSGKFEALSQAPYSALIQAFRQLIQQVLTESHKNIEIWRTELTKALSPNGQVIIEVIPEVAWLIGEQPPVAELPPTEARNRFELVFFDFVHTFAKKEHPLVLFLDDLQWADLASFSLIKQLLKDESLKYFLMIASYRDIDITPDHPLAGMIEELGKMHISVEHLKLSGLKTEHIKQMLIDALGNKDIDSLAELVMEKTRGNPFFVSTFLTKLYQENYLQYNTNRNEWDWDISVLKTLTISDNVVELVINNISKLPSEAQELLKIAANIGNQFDLKTLSLAKGKSMSEIAKKLWAAMEENLIIPLDESYKLVIADEAYGDVIKKNIYYKFSHDRVQQAAYFMENEEERKRIDLKIGRILLANHGVSNKDENIFEIVNHFNKAAVLIEKKTERIKVAELNLKAGNKAKLSVAYAPAANYFESAISFLGKSGWREHYKLAFESHEGFAQCLHLLGKFEQANTEFEKIVKHANTNLDKAKVTMLQVFSYTIQLKYDEALMVGLRGLSYLGVRLPEKPSVFRLGYDFIKVRWALKSQTGKSILMIPKIVDAEKKLISEYFERIAVSAYLKNPNLIGLLCLEGILFCLKNGYVAATAPTFMYYAMLSISAFWQFEKAYRYGKIAIRMVDEFDDPRMKTIALFVVFAIVAPWRKPYKDCLAQISKVFPLGRQAGELLYTNYAAALYPQMQFVRGESLEELDKKIKQMFLIADFTGNIDTFASLRTLARITSTLKGDKSIEYFKEKTHELLNHLIPITHPVAQVTSGVLCLMGAYFLNEMKLALSIHENIKKGAEELFFRPIFLSAEYYFYSVLVLVNLYQGVTWIEKVKFSIKIKRYIKKLRLFSENCPENFYAKYALAKAGWFHIRHRLREALQWYDSALSSARENEFIHIEAIANELVGRLCRQNRQVRHAKLYAQEAIQAYKRWGASAKVALVRAEHDNLRVPEGNGEYASARDLLQQSGSLTSAQQTYALDLTSVMKSSQVISSNVLLEDLLRSLIQIAIENAGANRGFLLLEQNRQLLISAYCEVSPQLTVVLQNEPVEKSDQLSLSVVQYVRNTQTPVVLGNAAEEGHFTSDPYILDKKPFSILCGPILHKGHLLGIFYLENNYTAGAFTADRLEVLKLLSSQAAISLENAQLYSAYDRFVPHEFLEMLGKHSIVDIHLGDHVQKNMSVLFCDIRGFTALSEKLTPAENFEFINDYLGYMEPAVQAHGGFIDKFIGDSIMALFPGLAQDAVLAGIDMLQGMMKFNLKLKARGLSPIKIGIGINTGNLMLGTLGGGRRIETSVISDAVNLASRIQELTKDYHSPLLIGASTYEQLSDLSLFQCRFVGRLAIRGKEKEIDIWEVYSGDDETLRFAKIAIASHYEQGIRLFFEKKYQEALGIFERCLEKLPEDKIVQHYISQCQKFLHTQ